MSSNELIDRYFDWIYELVMDNRCHDPSYRRLFSMLYDTEFMYMIPMDGNRAEDGVELRYRFGREYSYPDAMIACLLDDRSCSILEMMTALAIRCEEHIMDDPDIGNRTGQWFWDMIVSLGLDSMDDDNFDQRYVGEVLERFLNRDYCRNGEGSLFTVKHPRRDMRSIEIWYQMNNYLNELIKEGDIS